MEGLPALELRALELPAFELLAHPVKLAVIPTTSVAAMPIPRIVRP